MFSETSLLERVMWLIPLVLSLTVHEWAHAYSAFRLGDDTAARMGRLTLNPVPHIDPLGTLILPLLLVPFGWAKPVPVNPSRFNRDVNMRTGHALVAAAGPLSNIVLATLCVLLLAAFYRFSPDTLVRQDSLEMLLTRGYQVNVILAMFNILPIPPLDGAAVADRLMPRFLRGGWERFAAVGPAVLLAVIFLPSLLHFSLFSWPLYYLQRAASYVIVTLVTL